MGAGRRTNLSFTLLCHRPFLTWPQGRAALPDKESSSSSLTLLLLFVFDEKCERQHSGCLLGLLNGRSWYQLILPLVGSVQLILPSPQAKMEFRPFTLVASVLHFEVLFRPLPQVSLCHTPSLHPFLCSSQQNHVFDFFNLAGDQYVTLPHCVSN